MLDEVMPDPKRRRGLMLVMSSPSGAGKTSISRRVLELEPELDAVDLGHHPSAAAGREPTACTTCSSTRTAFATMAAGGELLEHATRLRPLLRHAQGGCRGRRWPAAATSCSTSTGRGRSSFGPPRPRTWSACSSCHPICPNSSAACAGRAQDPDDIVRYRLTQVASDVTHWPEYDYVLVNKDFEASVAAVRAILAAERLRRKRQPGLTDFVQQFRAVGEALVTRQALAARFVYLRMLVRPSLVTPNRQLRRPGHPLKLWAQVPKRKNDRGDITCCGFVWLS